MDAAHRCIVLSKSCRWHDCAELLILFDFVFGLDYLWGEVGLGTFIFGIVGLFADFSLVVGGSSCWLSLAVADC